MTELWRIVAGQVVGCPVGSEIELERDDAELRFIKPGVGLMARFDVGKAQIESSDHDRALSIRIPSEGLDVRLERSEPVVADENPPATLIRTYRSTTADAASAQFSTDLAVLQRQGYSVVSQIWADPPGAGIVSGVLAALCTFAAFCFLVLFQSLFFLLVFGAIAAVFAVQSLPRTNEGTLAVTYTLGEPSRPAPSSASSSDRLRELDRLRSDGLISTAEYDAKRAEIIASL